MYAICIYALIKDDFDLFDVLVICEDEHFLRVKKYLDILFKSDLEYSSKKIMSLIKLRKLTGDKKLRSYADGIARAYRRRALKNLVKQQEGVSLNPIKINYAEINSLLKIIENKVNGE